MARTLRVRTRTGWTTKPVADLPENRLTAEEVDDTFLELWDAMPVVVLQEAGESLPSRPEANVVFWFSWDEPPSSTDDPYDQWFEIPEIVVPAAPAAPTAPEATGGDGEVSLSWTLSPTVGTNAATGYRVYRNTSDSFGGASQLGSDLASNATTYTDSTPTNGTQYFYWITAFNATGESTETASVNATPAAASVDIVADIAWTNSYLADDAGVANGAEVTTLSDGTGSLDLTSSTGPEYVASDANFNSEPVMQFNGTNEDLTSTIGSARNSPFAIAYVGNFGGTDTNVVALGSNSPQADQTGLALSDNGGDVRTFAGTVVTTSSAASTSAAQLVIVQMAGDGTSEIIVDGTTTTADIGDRDWDEVIIGRNSPATGYSAIEVAFLGIKEGALLTSQEVTDIESWAADKYGITIS